MLAKPLTNMTDDIEQLLENLIRGNRNELDAFLTEVKVNEKLLDTETNVHCFMIGQDGSDVPRVEPLAIEIATRVLDYAIPRSEIEKAKKADDIENTTTNMVKLKMKAKSLFTSIPNTGEGGEMLLYMLVQSFLGFPQLLCKMPLKTSSQVHYHGSDGIHVGYDKDSKKLAIYWGESKLYQSIDSAITSCLDSIKPFLFDDETSGPTSRDMQLITSNLDVISEELEEILLKYLNPADPMYKKLQYRAVCLIGFDEGCYPKGPNEKIEELVMEDINKSLANWHNKINSKIKSRHPLDTFKIEIFLIPFPSVGKFRDFFLGGLQHV
ncbi:HamA C-terminal domain-containing protein [Sporosarcina sp. FA15]|uniref:HamA C-terminal domain-containing protein n=1 Tax=Sporosarcina sp. FA15 TaxID=3413031 RepID=UPI003F65FA45